MCIRDRINTATNVSKNSGLFSDSLIPSVSTRRPSGNKLFSKFLISFLTNNLVKIPTPITAKEFISVPIPGIIIF